MEAPVDVARLGRDVPVLPIDRRAEGVRGRRLRRPPPDLLPRLFKRLAVKVRAEVDREAEVKLTAELPLEPLERRDDELPQILLSQVHIRCERLHRIPNRLQPDEPKSMHAEPDTLVPQK